jgi:hypothetical protein
MLIANGIIPALPQSRSASPMDFPAEDPEGEIRALEVRIFNHEMSVDLIILTPTGKVG